MSDWKVGDLAVCVDNGPSLHPQYLVHKPSNQVLEIGRAYRVVGLGKARFAPCSLFIDGPQAADASLGYGWDERRFRKIRPDEHEACEEEFVTLLRKSKAPTHA